MFVRLSVRLYVCVCIYSWSVAVATNDASKPGEARAPLAEMEDIVVKKKKDKSAEVQSTFTALSFHGRLALISR